MARKPKSQARRNGSSGMPGWMWLAIGLVLGALAFAAYELRDRWQVPDGLLPRPDPQAQAKPTPESAEPVVPEAAPRPKPKFEFYEVLAEREVVIPDADLAEQARAEAQAATSTEQAPATDAAVDDGPRFLIQAGAFRSSEDAEGLKARIALTGEIARVEPAQINGATVYRVRMGPYPNASALAAAKQALSSHGIDGAQALRVK
jgi:cell division protein FtsN